jgi:predicted ATP-dependent Lon-type protease
LPDELNDSAIADRLCGIIPGWLLPKITDDGLAKGVGFLADWPWTSHGPACGVFGEVASQLRP